VSGVDFCVSRKSASIRFDSKSSVGRMKVVLTASDTVAAGGGASVLIIVGVILALIWASGGKK
jgi:hypothetical protein